MRRAMLSLTTMSSSRHASSFREERCPLLRAQCYRRSAVEYPCAHTMAAAVLSANALSWSREVAKRHGRYAICSRRAAEERNPIHVLRRAHGRQHPKACYTTWPEDAAAPLRGVRGRQGWGPRQRPSGCPVASGGNGGGNGGGGDRLRPSQGHRPGRKCRLCLSHAVATRRSHCRKRRCESCGATPCEWRWCTLASPPPSRATRYGMWFPPESNAGKWALLAPEFPPHPEALRRQQVADGPSDKLFESPSIAVASHKRPRARAYRGAHGVRALEGWSRARARAACGVGRCACNMGG